MEEQEKKAEVAPEKPAKPVEPSVLSQQYQVVVDLVIRNQTRLDTIKIAFLSVNFLMLTAFVVVLKVWGLDPVDWAAIDLKAILFFLPISGMVASVVWLAVSMRIQLMQRLHYFQLRQLENKMGLDDDSGIFNQTGMYWRGKNLTSHEGQKVLTYPSGADGSLGGITFRVWAWFMPLWFFFVFFYAFLALVHHYT